MSELEQEYWEGREKWDQDAYTLKEIIGKVLTTYLEEDTSEPLVCATVLGQLQAEVNAIIATRVAMSVMADTQIGQDREEVRDETTDGRDEGEAGDLRTPEDGENDGGVLDRGVAEEGSE